MNPPPHQGCTVHGVARFDFTTNDCRGLIACACGVIRCAEWDHEPHLIPRVCPTCGKKLLNAGEARKERTDG